MYRSRTGASEEKVAEVGITGLNAEFLRQLNAKALPMRVWQNWRACEAEIRKLRDEYDLHRFISAWIPVRQSSPPTPLTCTPLMKKSAK
ncbi:hypothetical protein ACLK17_00255 [Escherichia coli]